MGRTAAWRAAVAVPLALTALLLSAVSASAHSYLIESDPSDGAFLAKAPTQIVLLFSSGVTADFTSVELVEASGAHFQARSVVVDKATPSVVAVNLPEIPNGSYRLSFTTRDLLDLHQTAGSVVFGIGVAPPIGHAAPIPVPARPSEYLLRWTGLAGLAGLFGGLLLALMVVPRLPVSAGRRRVQSALIAFAFTGASIQVVSNAALIAIQASALGPDLSRNVIRLVADTEYGSRWLVSTLLSLATLLLLVSLWRRSRTGNVAGLRAEFARLGAWALVSTEARLVLFAVALAVAAALSGHSADVSGLKPVEVLVRSVHLASMGNWAGGVVALIVAVMALRRSGDRSASSTWALVVGFGPYAGAGLAGLAITGLLLSGAQVSSLTALFSTPYGTILIVKVALAGLVAMIALRHALLSWRGLGGHWQPGKAPRRLLLSLGLEGAGAMAIVLLAAVLGSSAPARGPQFEPPPAAVATLATQQRDGLIASVSMKPNREGPNLLSVQVVDPRRPARAPIESVAFLIVRPGLAAGAETLSTTRSGERFDAGTVSMKTGDVRISVLIRRNGVADTVVETPWRVNPPLVTPAPVVISSQPLAPLVNRVAIGLALIAGLVILLGFVRAGIGPRGHSWPGWPRRKRIEPLNEGLPDG